MITTEMIILFRKYKKITLNKDKCPIISGSINIYYIFYIK